MDGQWKGRSVSKINDGFETPDDAMPTHIDKILKPRGDIDDVMFPESRSLDKEVDRKSKKPRSLEKEVGKKQSPGARPVYCTDT